jgi:hypothetical protein
VGSNPTTPIAVDVKTKTANEQAVYIKDKNAQIKTKI